MVMQTRSNSAHTLPVDDYNNMYVDDCAVGSVEAGASDNDMFMEKPVSGR